MLNSQDEHDDCLKQMAAEAGGLYGSAVLRPPYERYEPRLVRLYKDLLEDVARRFWLREPTRLCLTCEREFPPNGLGAVTLVTPYVDAPTVSVLAPVCEECAGKHSDDHLAKVAIGGLFKPGSLRTIPAGHIHGPGRA